MRGFTDFIYKTQIFFFIKKRDYPSFRSTDIRILKFALENRDIIYKHEYLDFKKHLIFNIGFVIKLDNALLFKTIAEPFFVKLEIQDS